MTRTVSRAQDRRAGRVDLATTPVTSLRGVGPQVATRLERLGIATVQELLFHLPYRYQDRTRVVPIGSLRAGDHAVVRGEVQVANVRFGRRRSLVCALADGTGTLLLRLFHFSRAQEAMLTRGRQLRCYGEVRRGVDGPEMVHPEMTVLGKDGEDEAEEHLTPVYPTTEGLHQIALRKLTDQALAMLAAGDAVDEYLPPGELARLGFPTMPEALRLVHRPPPDTDPAMLETGRHPSQRRLAFEELLTHHLSLRQLRAQAEQRQAPPVGGDAALVRRFRDSLPFSLTDAQARVNAEVARDLARPVPMHRLVQGDVGSGKTVVAALAALTVIDAGWQVAMMAPTELLAEQHYQNFRGWLEPLGLNVAWLSARQGAKARRAALEGVAEGHAHMAVGTHALFQEQVAFSRLALVIVDEQHRFGVHQRLSLREKGQRDGLTPHSLIMTATPIPRTLAMAAYADLESSVIDALPPGRQPVETAVVPDTRRAEVVERIREACLGGQQAYWVCTLIEESETLAASAAEDTAAMLAEALPELRVGLVHGRMKGPDKERVMAAFKAGETQLLVATTVIEVGVDVPNASLMIIENAERLGLAQLHQLRGRVGRGSRRSVCLLLYHPPLSSTARDRLQVLRESGDGFHIARRDLEIRGPGEVLGTRQTGMLEFRIADLARDEDMLTDIERVAGELLEQHPERVPLLVRRWLGDRVDYGGA